MTTLCPDDSRHGSVAGRVAGCGCTPCRAAGNRYRRTRKRRRAYGTWQPFVDAAPAREHLAALAAAGMGRPRIAELSGVSVAAIQGLSCGRPGQTEPVQRCRPKTAAAILAVRVSLDTVADKGVIDATGTLRRLRALVAIGWTLQDIGRQLPGHPEAIRLTIRNGRSRVTGAMARAARDLYRSLSGTPAPDSVWGRRTRKMASGLGWEPPAAWDDSTIDDPDAEPYADLPPVSETIVDWVAVERAIKGNRVELTPAEKHFAVHAGRDLGLPYSAIALALRMSGSTVKDLGAKPLPQDCEVAA